jgi:UDP-N-acetylglucosamine 2-epimerase (non-hydrolysing)
MRLSIVLGTRPEIIKLSPIIRECERLGVDFFILHTGQHYSYRMDEVFFKQLALPEVKHNLDVGSDSHGAQTGQMLVGIEKVLQQEKPDVVLVQGDTNTALAGALAAAKLGVEVGHVEAGLRSYDKQMPEEINRIVVDHCSTFLFAPTLASKRILLGEGIPRSKIVVTGNTVVDAVFQNLELSEKRRSIDDVLPVDDVDYLLVTVHRQENVDDETRFRGILRGLELVQQELGWPVVYPVHPRAHKQLEIFNVEVDNIMFTESLDYLSFLQLEKNAQLVLTDSGGVQEEACILGVPSVTLRESTERPETVEVGANTLAGVDPYVIVEKVKMMLNRKNGWRNPFGNGDAGRRIVNRLQQCSSSARKNA